MLTQCKFDGSVTYVTFSWENNNKYGESYFLNVL